MLRIGLIGLALAGSALADDGLVIVANDEWTLSNTGFTQAGDSAVTYVENIIALMGGAGDYIAVTNNFGLNETSLKNAVEGTGSTWTVMNTAPSLEELQTYDGVFAGGNPSGLTTSLLRAYVDAGGCLYIMAGTGGGGEVPLFNGVMHLNGLSIEPNTNGIIGLIDVSSATHPLLDGVDQLYQNNGRSVVDLADGDDAEVVFTLDEDGLYGVIENICSADFNNDGAQNILDFVSFQAAFVAGDLRADCDGDYQFSILDFVCYQGVFASGCQ